MSAIGGVGIGGMTELNENRAVRFGEFVLDPREQRVLGPAGELRLGRKAFRLLEALIARAGSLLTKDALFETVWDGTIVSESALTATIKELRRALGDEAKNPRFIENVYGRGYRFVAPVTQGALAPVPAAVTLAPASVTSAGEPGPPAAEVAAHPAGISRRALVGWGAAAAATAGVAAVMVGGPRLFGTARSPEVDALVSHARQLMGSNLTVGQNEAIGLLRRAVDLAPGFADGWGLLGLAYAVPLHFRRPDERSMLRARARAAADRALELDPGNAFGELARGVALPFIGAWRERDRHLDRAVRDRPNDSDVLTWVACVLVFNGRASAAIPCYERVGRRPFTPGDSSGYVNALWNAGRIEEAERTADDAAKLYPTQQTLWYDRYQIMAFGNRTDAAIALLDDAAARPLTVDDTMLRDLRAQAEALRAPGSPQSRQTLERAISDARIGAFEAETAIRLASALGDRDAAFEIADAFYFSRGFIIPDYQTWGPFASLDERDPQLLFDPGTAPLRADPRFERLVGEIGLDAYWRQANVVPDYRLNRRRR